MSATVTAANMDATRATIIITHFNPNVLIAFWLAHIRDGPNNTRMLYALASCTMMLVI